MLPNKYSNCLISHLIKEGVKSYNTDKFLWTLWPCSKGQQGTFCLHPPNIIFRHSTHTTATIHDKNDQGL